MISRLAELTSDINFKVLNKNYFQSITEKESITLLDFSSRHFSTSVMLRVSSA